MRSPYEQDSASLQMLAELQIRVYFEAATLMVIYYIYLHKLDWMNHYQATRVVTKRVKKVPIESDQHEGFKSSNKEILFNWTSAGWFVSNQQFGSAKCKSTKLPEAYGWGS